MTSPKILISDDSRFMRVVLKKLLYDLEYVEVVGEAGTGKETIKQAAELKPDLVILDIGLPDMNGVKVASQLLQIYPSIKIIVSTNSNTRQIETIAEALSCGVKDIIQKPFHPETVLETVIKVIMED